MRKLLLTIFAAGLALSANAGHFRGGGWYSGSCYRGGFGFYPGFSVSIGYPGYSYYPYADYGYSGYYDAGRPNYAVGGTLLGALTGGIIGNSIHHQGWEGAAIGAGAGLLLGGIAENTARRQERQAAAAIYQAAPAPQPQPQIQPETQTSLPQSQITSKPCATSTYYWTPRPQIADAHRVPDAPTF